RWTISPVRSTGRRSITLTSATTSPTVRADRSVAPPAWRPHATAGHLVTRLITWLSERGVLTTHVDRSRGYSGIIQNSSSASLVLATQFADVRGEQKTRQAERRQAESSVISRNQHSPMERRARPHQGAG